MLAHSRPLQRAPCFSSRACAPRPRALARAAAPTVENLRHVTLDGQGLELLLSRSDNEDPSKPPLLFLHGSYHGAWCWQEKFLPYFASKGFTSYAVSFRGQGKSDILVDQMVAGTLDSHAKDIGDLIACFPTPPIVVGHSFGGLILQKYLLDMSGGAKEGLPQLAGAAFLCSVPPSGNKNLVARFFLKDFFLSLRVTYGFIAKTFIKSSEACRELFFSKDLPEADLLRYQAQLALCSPVRLMDLQDVKKRVPLAAPTPFTPPVFVLGGKNDVVIDVPAVEETASYFNVTPILMEGLAHDCMLDTRWESVAQELEAWLKRLA